MKQKTSRTVAAFAATDLMAGFTAGCSHNNDPIAQLPPAQQSQAERLSEISTKTGGDWNKLTPADKDFLVNKLSGGNVNGAKMLLTENQARTKPPGPLPFTANGPRTS